MKKGFIFFLAGLIILLSAHNLIVCILFSFNQIAITQTLCEKRNMPNSGCKGKCYLKKQLNKEKDTPSNQETNTSFVIEFIEIISFQDSKSPFFALLEDYIFNTNTSNQYSFSFLKEIIHPPCLS